MPSVMLKDSFSTSDVLDLTGVSANALYRALTQ